MIHPRGPRVKTKQKSHLISREIEFHSRLASLVFRSPRLASTRLASFQGNGRINFWETVMYSLRPESFQISLLYFEHVYCWSEVKAVGSHLLTYESHIFLLRHPRPEGDSEPAEESISLRPMLDNVQCCVEILGFLKNLGFSGSQRESKSPSFCWPRSRINKLIECQNKSCFSFWQYKFEADKAFRHSHISRITHRPAGRSCNLSGKK